MQWPNPFGIREALRYDLPAAPFQREALHPLSKLMLISDNPDRLAEINEAASSLPVERAYSMATILEIAPQGVSKGHGLQILLEGLGLADRPLVVAGDGENDFSLFDIPARAFAPVTSPLVVQERAGAVIDPAPNGLLAALKKAYQLNG